MSSGLLTRNDYFIDEKLAQDITGQCKSLPKKHRIPLAYFTAQIKHTFIKKSYLHIHNFRGQYGRIPKKQ